jgi:hypothetical protein
MRRTPLAAAALAVAALAAPTAAQAQMDQYAAPWPVTKYDQTWTLQSNTTAEFRMPLTEMGTENHVLVPCWGFEVEGPGVDVAAANLDTFGPIPTPEFAEGEPHDVGAAVQQPDGSWMVPDSNAVLRPDQFTAGAECRTIGWDFFVPDTQASAAAKGKARRTHRPVKIVKRKTKTIKGSRKTTKKAKAAQAANGPVDVTLAGFQFARGRSIDIVVRVTTGELSGPTTLTTHGRVLLQPKP